MFVNTPTEFMFAYTSYVCMPIYIADMCTKEASKSFSLCHGESVCIYIWGLDVHGGRKLITHTNTYEKTTVTLSAHMH